MSALGADVEEQLRAIGEDLGLGGSGGEQDWGLELSDPTRVDELLDYCEPRSAAFLPAVWRQYADLVLQSANEALEDDLPVPEDRLRRFASDLATSAPDALASWTSLRRTEADPWPVLRLLPDSSHGPIADRYRPGR